jgi:hypothetical protein
MPRRDIFWQILLVLFGAMPAFFVGIAVSYFTTKTPDLVYETFPPTGFVSQTTQLKIYNARIENVGNKEAEDVQVRLSLPTIIDDLQVEPNLKSISFDVSPIGQSNVKEIRFTRLNSRENVRLSILSNKEQDAPLGIEVRAKGINGHVGRD